MLIIYAQWTQDVTGQAKLINGGFYPGDEWTGDVARIIMYMYVHYGLETDPQLVAYNNTTTNKEDRMPDMFLKWNVQDKVSEFEKVRNEIIAETQGSRNPFIDNPYLANAKNFVRANLYDFNGRLLGTNLGTEVDLKPYPAGIYILAIHLQDGNIVTKKVIKK